MWLAPTLQQDRDAVMIDVVIADHQELSRIGMVEVLAVAEDIQIVAQPQTPQQLLATLEYVYPRVLILSTHFLPVFSKIQQILKRRKTRLLVLAEDNDRVAYMSWLPVDGVIYPSLDALAIVHAVRRVARRGMRVQNHNPDRGKHLPKVA
jgi:DNA-binding NarL/FixJ family response regulator